MNERIKELADEAGFMLEGDNIYTHNFHPINEFIDNFVELVVEECANIVVDCDVEKYGDLREGISHCIKKHFGIE